MPRTIRLLAFLALTALAGCGGRSPQGVAPQEALQRLAAGNDRYATEKLTHPDLTPERRKVVAGG
ncbi:MAG: carbonic anhydrase, partial [Deltaproteobacteria bacterium]|nr:carbonic anhydrase [Deltaproteobacteria bacterium]